MSASRSSDWHQYGEEQRDEGPHAHLTPTLPANGEYPDGGTRAIETDNSSFQWQNHAGSSLHGLMHGNEYSILLEPYQAVYIDIAKVASSSIKSTLASLLALDGIGGNPHDIDFPRPPPGDPSGDRIYPSHYSFAFVRNPWDRLVSCYRDKIRGEVNGFTVFAESGVAHCLARFGVFSPGMAFGDFVRAVASIPDEDADEHFRSQADFVTNANGIIAVDFVGRYETLKDDFARIVRTIGLPPRTELPRLQAAPTASPASYYTAETRDIVRRRYIRDVDLFEYASPSA